MAPHSESTFVASLSSDEIADGERRVVAGNNARVLVCRSARSLHAVAELCPHALQPLLGGEVSDGRITCPHHGACFDLDTGKPLNQVTAAQLPIFEVRECGGRIEIWSTPSTKSARTAARRLTF